MTTVICSVDLIDEMEFLLVWEDDVDGGGEIISHEGSLGVGWKVAFISAKGDSSMLVGESKTVLAVVATCGAERWKRDVS